MTTAIAKSAISTRSATTGISLSRKSANRIANREPITKTRTISLTLRNEGDAAIVGILTAPSRRGRKTLLPLEADVRIGKHMRSNRDLRKMLLATTEALENASEGKPGPLTNAHLAIATQARNVLSRVNA
jgi:hypothetical protein